MLIQIKYIMRQRRKDERENKVYKKFMNELHAFRGLVCSPSAACLWKKNDLSLNQTVRLGIPLRPPSTQSEGGGHEVAEDSTSPMLNAISKRLKAPF
jgi:hypothetical protein